MIKFIPYTFENSDNKYFDFRKVMSYGTKFVVVIGARRIGKTYGAKQIVLPRCIDNDIKFVWLRDNDEARKKLAMDNGKKFFSDCAKMNRLPKEFEGVISGEVIKINGKTYGYLMPSSTFQNYKGNDFEEIKWVIYDEFIAEHGKRTNGNSTWEIINSLYTICSTRTDVRIIFLANALDRGDDMLRIFGFKIKEYGIYVNREKDVALHYCDDSVLFKQDRENSVIGRLIKGTEYEDNLFNNKFLDNEVCYFSKKPPKCTLFCILHTPDYSCRCYLSEDLKIYVCGDFNKDCCIDKRFVNDYNLVDTKHSLLPKTYLQALRDTYEANDVLFENAFVRKTFIEVVGKSR